jgi:four helix bundle protein
MSAKPSRSAELENRMIRFAVDIVKLVAILPNTAEAKHIGTQLLRSGTSAAPNYAEARAAESRADFIHKLKIALKELNETSTWLRILQGSIAENPDILSRLIAENAELCRILVASIQTARRNNGQVD